MPQSLKLFRRLLLIALPAILLAVAVIPSRAAGREIYPPPERARIDLAAGLRTAAASHKHVILDFGGDWCVDCNVLDIYFHDPINKPLLDANYVLVRINIGRRDQNLKIAERYQVPMDKGVPALAVLDEHGKLLYSQRNTEFGPMRHMESSAVTSFLLQWKPSKPGI
jgi:thiol:disulfide interchange protein